MLVTLDEAKAYLRVDGTEEDSEITQLMLTARELGMAVARAGSTAEFEALGKPARMAVLYGTAYLYEHREDADYHALTMTMRSLLFGVRKEGF